MILYDRLALMWHIQPLPDPPPDRIM